LSDDLSDDRCEIDLSDDLTDDRCEIDLSDDRCEIDLSDDLSDDRCEIDLSGNNNCKIVGVTSRSAQTSPHLIMFFRLKGVDSTNAPLNVIKCDV